MNRFVHGSRIPAAVALACAIFLIGGCASVPPPTEQIAVSKAAYANAVSAGGNEYAPVEMRSAQDRLCLLYTSPSPRD